MVDELKPRLTLTYFADEFVYASRATAIRLALQYGAIPFEDERVDIAENRDHLIFKSLPVLHIHDKNITVTQSQAILRYVGRLAGLYPVDDPAASLLVDEILSCIDEDIHSRLSATIRERNQDRKIEMRQQIETNDLPRFFGGLEKLLSQRTMGYAVGNALTIADLRIFSIWQTLRAGKIEPISPTILDPFPFIKAIVETVFTQIDIGTKP